MSDAPQKGYAMATSGAATLCATMGSASLCLAELVWAYLPMMPPMGGIDSESGMIHLVAVKTDVAR